MVNPDFIAMAEDLKKRLINGDVFSDQQADILAKSVIDAIADYHKALSETLLRK